MHALSLVCGMASWWEEIYRLFTQFPHCVCVCVCVWVREREYACMCAHACVHAYVHQDSNIWRIAKIFANLTIDPEIQLCGFIVLLCNLYNLQTYVCVSTSCCVVIRHYNALPLTWNWKNTSFQVTYLLYNYIHYVSRELTGSRKGLQYFFSQRYLHYPQLTLPETLPIFNVSFRVPPLGVNSEIHCLTGLV